MNLLQRLKSFLKGESKFTQKSCDAVLIAIEGTTNVEDLEKYTTFTLRDSNETVYTVSIRFEKDSKISDKDKESMAHCIRDGMEKYVEFSVIALMIGMFWSCGLGTMSISEENQIIVYVLEGKHCPNIL